MKKLKYTVGFLLLAQAFALADDSAWHLLIEPTFQRNEVSWPVANSKVTVLVPARFYADELHPMTQAEARQLRVTQEAVVAVTPAEASKVLATLKPEYVRGENKVIDYAVLQSTNPLTASAVLAPDFAEKFAETLGPDILIAIPNRYRIYVFPKLSQNYKGLADVVVAEYESSPCPVSKEVFQLRNGKLIAVGRYR